MTVYPAIDMKDGKAVRLKQGLASETTVYDAPAALAQRWQSEGAQWLHLVDLDGAFSGEGKNANCVREILRQVSIPVQLGGGIRSLKAIETWLNLGVKRVILGTAAAENPPLMKQAADAFGQEAVAVGIDAKNSRVMARGWVSDAGLDAVEFGKMAKDAGIETTIYTDISKDGMMQGPNVLATAQMVSQTGLSVIGSGGVATLEDIRALKEAGCSGVILGKSLLSGAFTIKQAREVCGNGKL